jgi:peptidoglycan/LPS O-acetylase OafA/YrhL
MATRSCGTQPTYHFIEALRALAALWVLIGHCLIWGGWARGTLLTVPGLAVDLFMMISGFLMAALAGREPLHHAHNRLRFYLRRLFRLAPVYYLALAVAWITQHWVKAGYQALQDANPGAWLGLDIIDSPNLTFDLASAVAHVTFVFGLSPFYASSTMLPDWSLGLEMQFYLLFPAMFLLMHRIGFALAAALLVAAALVIAAWTQGAFLRAPSFLPLKLMHFLAGMLIWRAVHAREALLGLLAIALPALDFSYSRSFPVALPLMAAGVLALALMDREGTTPPALARVLGSRWVRFGSDTSYSVYLVHGFLIAATGLLVHPWAAHERVLTMLALVVPASYALGYVVHRLVELPGIALGRRVIDRLVPRRAEGLAAHPVQPQAQRAEQQADG